MSEALKAIPTPVRHILVVDDDPDFRQLLIRMLYAYDSFLEVTTAVNASDAMKKLRQQPPDLMLLDIMLPEQNGWMLLDQKQADADLKSIPVIIISAQDPAEQPLISPLIVATMGEGLSKERILPVMLSLSEILLTPTVTSP